MGIHLAGQLTARGDRVVFLAPRALATALDGAPFAHVPSDHVMPRLDALLAQIAADTRADSLVLCDVMTAVRAIHGHRQKLSTLSALGVPIIAMDAWNVRRTNRKWDVGAAFDWQLPDSVLRPAHRMIPAPTAEPVAAAGVYDALPKLSPLDAATRAEGRRRLGLGEGERLILMPEAVWQTPRAQRLAWQHRASALLHDWVALLLARQGRARVIHVASVPSEALGMVLGARYQWRDQMTPATFQGLLAMSDLLFTCNVVGTTIGAAIAAQVPILVGYSSYAAKTIDELNSRLSSPPSPALRSWLARALPLMPFRVWPLGLFSFVAHVVDNTTYASCFRAVELFEEEAFGAALSALLWSSDARAELEAKQQRFTAHARRLPSALQVFDGHFGL